MNDDYLNDAIGSPLKSVDEVHEFLWDSSFLTVDEHYRNISKANSAYKQSAIASTILRYDRINKAKNRYKGYESFASKYKDWPKLVESQGKSLLCDSLEVMKFALIRIEFPKNLEEYRKKDLEFVIEFITAVETLL